MTIQSRIWASRIQRLPEIKEDHMVGKTVTVGEKVGTVTKEITDDATGEVYEVELEDGSTITASAHEMQLGDPGAGSGQASPDVAEGNGDGSGAAESKEEDDDDQLDEYIKGDGTRRRCKGGDGRRKAPSV